MIIIHIKESQLVLTSRNDHLTSHVACGSYQIHPDHTNLHTFRPSSEEAFRNLWGAVCSVDYGGKFGQQRLSYCDAINVTRREPPD